MNISNTYARNKTLVIVVAVSLGLHVFGLVIFGTFKIVESITREEQTFEAPEIIEAPEEVPEYEVNLEQRNQSSAPPRPNPIVVDSPDVSIPALNIDVNIANSSSYGRGSGGFGSGTGVSDMREMVIQNLDFFGAKMESDAQRMLFVVDMSGSMILDQRGLDGYRVVVDELVKTLKPFVGIGSFNVLAFSREVERFRGRAFKDVSEDSLKYVEKWLLSYDPAEVVKGKSNINSSSFGGTAHSGTRADLALIEAFDLNPKMIIFLSDGDPTGKSKEEVLKIVDELQTDPKTPINTLSYKSRSGRGFLRDLAAKNEGTYTEVN